MTDRVSANRASLLHKTAAASPQIAPSKPQVSPQSPTLESDRADITALYSAPPGTGDLLERAMAAENRIKAKNAELAKQQEEQQKNYQEAAAQGMMIGGAVGTALHFGVTAYSSIKKRVSDEPLGVFGKTMVLVGAGLSGYGLGTDGMNIAKDLSAKTLDYRALGVHSLDLVGNAITLGGMFATASGVGTLPGLLAVGAGNALTLTAQMLER